MQKAFQAAGRYQDVCLLVSEVKSPCSTFRRSKANNA